MTSSLLLRSIWLCIAVAALVAVSCAGATPATPDSVGNAAGSATGGHAVFTAPPFLDGPAPTLERAASPTGPAARAVGDGPVITSVSPRIASAGTNTTITITGTGFGTKASRESPADVMFLTYGARTLPASGRINTSYNADEIVSWSDTEVLVRVPIARTSQGQIFSASSGILRLVTDARQTSNYVPFAVSFGSEEMTWAAPPIFSVNDNCPNVTGGAEAVRRAVTTWNAALPDDFQINASGSTTVDAFGEDGVNTIAWGPSPGAWIWTNGSTIVEADIILPSSETWTTGVAGGSVRSIESYMLAYLAFSIGICPLYGFLPAGPSDMGKVVFDDRSAYAGNENLVTLHPADRAAAAYLYGGGPANPPLLSAAFGANGSQARAPLAVQFTDVSIGGATGWRWDFGDGGTSTGQNPVHTYTVSGTYTVSLTVSAPGFPDDTVRTIDLFVIGAPVLAVPGGVGLPTDTDGDGLCDDVNGNGRKDFGDVVLFFNRISWIGEDEPADAFDCNANGQIDFADVVWLFNNL